MVSPARAGTQVGLAWLAVAATKGTLSNTLAMLSTAWVWCSSRVY